MYHGPNDKGDTYHVSRDKEYGMFYGPVDKRIGMYQGYRIYIRWYVPWYRG